MLMFIDIKTILSFTFNEQHWFEYFNKVRNKKIIVVGYSFTEDNVDGLKTRIALNELQRIQRCRILAHIDYNVFDFYKLFLKYKVKATESLYIGPTDRFAKELNMKYENYVYEGGPS